MKLQLISDLHSEFHSDPVEFVRSIAIAPHLDVLVIAGDLVVCARQSEAVIREIFDYFSQQAKDIVFVTGNHEYYGGSREHAHQLLSSVMPTNFHWLRNSDVTLHGQHFYGGTLWFADHPLNEVYACELNDFNCISGFRDWVYTDNREFIANAQTLVTAQTIVVSHHLPSNYCIAPQYAGSSLNRFFVTDLSQLIAEKRPSLWMYGHTHSAFDGVLEGTRLLCWPRGYPHEVRRQPEPQRSYAPMVSH